MKKVIFALIAVLIIINKLKAQGGTFTYQFENSQAKAGNFIFKCADTSLNFEASASAGYLVASNNPYYQSTKDIGPIPNGTWKIIAIKNEKISILILQPTNDVQIKYRNGFLIHGAKEGETADQASIGCIILAKEFREKLLAAFKKFGVIIIKVTNFTMSDQNNKG